MTEGRGSAAAGSMVGFLTLALAFHSLALVASAATLTVGGSQGWNIGVDYTTWAASQTFAAGDILFFPYAAGAHNVAEVDKAGYDACSASSTAPVHTDGNTNVTLSTGAHYYLCSFPSHCSLGMKLAVTVGASATPPAPSPSTSVGTPPPSRAPAAPPARAPSAPGLTPVPSVTAPVSAPVSASASTPASAPTPTPTPAANAPAPTSTPTPSPVNAPVPSSTSVGTPPSATESPSPPNMAPRIASTASLAAALLFSAAVLAVL